MGAPVDTSVIVPGVGDATAWATGETRVLNGLSLATVGRRAEQRRLNAFDFVAVAVDVLHGRDSVAKCVLHDINGDGLDAVGQLEFEVLHGWFRVLCVL